MSKPKTLPGYIARCKELEEIIEDLQTQNQALATTCNDRLERIGELVARVEELEAEVKIMHEINEHLAEKTAKVIRHKAADIVIQVRNAEMAGEAHRDIMNLQTPKI